MHATPRESDPVALAVMAHPDDAEFLCVGTLGLLREKGWKIHIATMTAGDCGSERLGPDEISRVRRTEAASAAQVLSGSYHCLGCRDGLVAYDQETILKTVKLIRVVRPKVVFTHSPTDYMIDHEVCSALARNATFFATVRNLETEGCELFRPVPYLYYSDPVEGQDIFGQRVEPTTVVDISALIDTKESMLACHASQRDWLRQQHGVDEYLKAMRGMSAGRGADISVDYAEGFRQHLGNGYPRDNILQQVLGDPVHQRSVPTLTKG